MANEQQQRPQNPPASNGDLLRRFLESVRQSTATISNQILGVSPSGPQQLIIAAAAESFAANTELLVQYVETRVATLSPIQRADVDQFLKYSDAVNIANRGAQVTSQVLSAVGQDPGGQIPLGFLDWLQHNRQLIKKIIQRILHLLAITLPPFILELVEILDELVDLLISLFGGLFGLRISQIADDLSAATIRFINQRTQLALWEAAVAVRARELSRDEPS